MTKTCGRCHNRIEDDEEYTSYIPQLATGAAPTVYRHVRPCRQAPTQTYPVTSRR